MSDGQQLSHHQLASYFDVADQALEEAFKRALQGDKPFSRFTMPEQPAQLAIVAQGVINEWAASLRKLKTNQMLDETMVVLTSNLGNASSHDNKNMPVLFAGGGFQHGQHLAFDQKDNYPLPNLYRSTLHRLGLQDDQFATSTGGMDGLKVS